MNVEQALVFLVAIGYFVLRLIEEDELDELGSVDDRRAAVLDVLEPAPPRRCAAPPAETSPSWSQTRLRAGRDRLAGHVGAGVGAAEDVHEVDRLVDLGERADARDAEHLAHERPHRDGRRSPGSRR